MARKLQPIEAIVRRLEGVPREAVEEIVEAASTAGEEQATRELGSRTLRGATFRVVLDRARTTDHSAKLVVRGTPAGSWVWLEKGVDSHSIRPRRQPRRAMPLGGDRFASGAVDHPGVRKWSGAWTRTVADIDEAVPRILSAAVVKVSRRG